tara:strand:- start:103 stop:402 length:300 start_codon:yes stop_codon:yes gene_type:complete
MSCSAAVFGCDLGNVENALSNRSGFRDDNAVAGIRAFSGYINDFGIRNESVAFGVYDGFYTTQFFSTLAGRRSVGGGFNASPFGRVERAGKGSGFPIDQ